MTLRHSGLLDQWERSVYRDHYKHTAPFAELVDPTPCVHEWRMAYREDRQSATFKCATCGAVRLYDYSVSWDKVPESVGPEAEPNEWRDHWTAE